MLAAAARALASTCAALAVAFDLPEGDVFFGDPLGGILFLLPIRRERREAGVKFVPPPSVEGGGKGVASRRVQI